MTENSIIVEVRGTPVAKGRPRMTKGGTAYTPAKTRKWERLCRIHAQQVMGDRKPLTGPLEVVCDISFSVAGSWPKWKQEAALAGQIMHTGKPDADNVIKAAKDACNGVVWLDDSQVVRLMVRKVFTGTPSVKLMVYPLTGVVGSNIRTSREYERVLGQVPAA